MIYRNVSRRLWGLSLCLLILAGFDAYASELSPKEIAQNLIVKITGSIGDGKNNLSGAGIIFHVTDNLVYIVTANHVVRKRSSEAHDLEVEFIFLPGFPVKATLSRKYDPDFDVAVLVVSLAENKMLSPEMLKKNIPSVKVHSVDIESKIDEGEQVRPIGHPLGYEWFIPYAESRFRDYDGTMIRFEYDCDSGYSGGGLFTESWELVGMIQKSSGPVCEALSFERIMEKLESWRYKAILHEKEASIRLSCIENGARLPWEQSYALGAFLHYGHDHSVRIQNWGNIGTQRGVYDESVGVAIIPYLQNIETHQKYIFIPDKQQKNFILLCQNGELTPLQKAPSAYPSVILTPVSDETAQEAEKKALQTKLVDYLKKSSYREFMPEPLGETSGFSVVPRYNEDEEPDIICVFEGKIVGSLKQLAEIILAQQTLAFLDNWEYGPIQITSKGTNKNLVFIYTPFTLEIPKPEPTAAEETPTVEVKKLTKEELALNLIVKITGDMGEAENNIVGAGIIVAQEGDFVYLATADHVVRRGPDEAQNLKVLFRFWPGSPITARLLEDHSQKLDFTMLRVNLRDSEMPLKTFHQHVRFDQIRYVTDTKKQLHRRDELYPIGHPGYDWQIALSPGKFRRVVDGLTIHFEYDCEQGHSGGGVFTEQWDLVGMLQRQFGKDCEALSFQGIRAKLSEWNLATDLAPSIVPPAGSATKLPREASSLPQELEEPTILFEIILPEMFKEHDLSDKIRLDGCHETIQRSPENPLMYKTSCPPTSPPKSIFIKGFQKINAEVKAGVDKATIVVAPQQLFSELTVSLPDDALLSYVIHAQELHPGEQKKSLLLPFPESSETIEILAQNPEFHACNFSLPFPLQATLEGKNLQLLPPCRQNSITWPEHWGAPLILDQTECVKANFPAEESRLECLRHQKADLTLSWESGWQPIRISHTQLNSHSEYQVTLSHFVPFWPLQDDDPWLRQIGTKPVENCQAPPHYEPSIIEYCIGESACRQIHVKEPTEKRLPDIAQAGWKQSDPLPTLFRLHLKSTSPNPLYRESLYLEWRPVDGQPAGSLNTLIEPGLRETLPVDIDVGASTIRFSSNAKFVLFQDKNSCEAGKLEGNESEKSIVLPDSVNSVAYTATALKSLQANACNYAAVLKGTRWLTPCTRGQKKNGKIFYRFEGGNAFKLKCLENDLPLPANHSYELGAFFHHGHDFSIRIQNWGAIRTGEGGYSESVAIVIVPYLKSIDTGKTYIFVPDASPKKPYLLSCNDTGQAIMKKHPSFYHSIMLTPLQSENAGPLEKKVLQDELLMYLKNLKYREFINPLIGKDNGFKVIQQYTERGIPETICVLGQKKIGSLESLLTLILSKRTASFLNGWKHGAIRLEPKGIGENIKLSFTSP